MPSERKTLRVLVITRWLCNGTGGGVQTYLDASDKAVDPDVISFRYACLMPGEVPKFVRHKPVMGIAGVSKWRNALRMYKEIERVVDEIDVIMIHGFTDWHFLVGALVAKRHRKPYISRIAGQLSQAYLRQTLVRRVKAWLFIKLIGRRLLRESSSVIATTFMEKRIVESIGSRAKILVVPSGVYVPPENYVPGSDELENHGLRLLFMGRIDPIKALPVLFKAVATMRQSGKNWNLDIMGDGSLEYMESLKKLALDLNIGQLLKWHGYLSGEEKKGILNRATVLLLPSYSENFGFSAAEAMAAGIPVIVSDGVALCDIIQEYGCGFVFPVGDSCALADSIMRYSDRALRVEHGRNAYRCARKEFSLEVMGSGLEKACKDAVGWPDD